MKSETAEYLAKSRECLAAAKTVLPVSLPGVAAKEAYLATYHAAHALVFERTGRAAKTHRGLRTAYARTARDEPELNPDFSRLLSRAYKFKEVADCGVGPTIEITTSDAQQAIDASELFVRSVSDLLQSNPS